MEDRAFRARHAAEGLSDGAGVLVVVATEAERPSVPAEILVCGIGKTGAAAAVASRVALGGVRAIVSFGVAGAYPRGGLAIGDVAVATEVAVVDEGLEIGERFLPFDRPGMHVPGAAWMPTDAAMRDALLSGAPPSFAVAAGRIATVSVCAGTHRLAEERGALGAIAEGMEGASIAHVAAARCIPFAEVRGISNACGPRDGRPFELAGPLAHADELLRRLFR
ncbi:MAG: Futalosine hydrolase [Planctomycetes bacterium]|nr:Futalosine hydrolase [Planctomycetota bacterium]